MRVVHENRLPEETHTDKNTPRQRERCNRLRSSCEGIRAASVGETTKSIETYVCEWMKRRKTI